MAYVGRQAGAAPLTSADIPDGSITADKIAAGGITAADVAADMATQAELDTVSTVASAALPKAGGAMTGAITTNSTFDGIDIATRDALHAPLASPTFTGTVAIPNIANLETAVAANTAKVSFTPDAAQVFNESSADVDFRVESNGQTHMLFIDGSTDSIGICDSTPDEKLCIGDTATGGQINMLKVQSATVYTKLVADDNVGFSNLDASHILKFSIAGTQRFYVDSSSLYITNGFMRIGSYIRPDSNGVHDLGLTGDRWEDVWCTQGAFNNSDINLKRDITPSALGLDFINKLNPVSYKWKDVPEVLWTEDDEDFKIMVNAKGIEVGDIKVEAKIHKRTHYGLVAQEVVSTLDELGIDTVDFAAYADGKAKLDSDGNKIGKDGDCALRYTEFISPMIKAIQELSAKVTALENA